MTMIKLQPTQGRPVTRRNYITEAVCGLSLFVAITLSAEPSAPVLPGTQPLTMEGDLAAQIVGGIDTYLDRLLADAPKSRARYWNRDLSSPEAYVKSVETNRQHLAAIMGVVDKREPVQLEFFRALCHRHEGEPG